MKRKNTDSDSEDREDCNQLHTPIKRYYIALKIDDKSIFENNVVHKDLVNSSWF